MNINIRIYIINKIIEEINKSDYEFIDIINYSSEANLDLTMSEKDYLSILYDEKRVPNAEVPITLIYKLSYILDIDFFDLLPNPNWWYENNYKNLKLTIKNSIISKITNNELK